jgi:hypothetical protein
MRSRARASRAPHTEACAPPAARTRKETDMESNDVYQGLCDTMVVVDACLGRLRDLREELVLIARDMPDVDVEQICARIRWVRRQLKKLPTA